ncbi:MAG: hypothetical protein R3E95_20435 [Thiolinea sp.]
MIDGDPATPSSKMNSSKLARVRAFNWRVRNLEKTGRTVEKKPGNPATPWKPLM